MRPFSSWPAFVPKPLRLTMLAMLVICASVSPRYSVTAKAQTRRPGANVMAWQTLKWAQHVPTTYKGRADSVAKLQAGAVPLALVSADFDGDGIADLVVGYAGGNRGLLALHRGNIDAFAPRSHASWLAIANEQFPSPFLAQAGVVEVPEAPHFIVTGDFMGDGNIGILTGTRGSQHLYFLAGDGKGKFSAPKLINLPGALTALASGEVGIRDGKTDVVASVQSGKSGAMLVYKGSAGGLTATGISYPLPQAATQLEIGDLHGDGFADVAALAGGEVFIVHPTAQAGEDTSALLEHVSSASGARSIAVGGFIWDRHSRNQLAVLSPNGVVQILSPEELDTRPFTEEERFERRNAALHGKSVSDANPVWAGEAHSWNVVKSNSVSAPMSANVRLMGAGLAHSRPLDLMVVDPADTRVHVLPANTSFEADNDEGELTIETGDAPTAVLPMRVNHDARRGLVMIGRSVSHPKTMAPLPDPTYTVNRFDDPAASVANATTYCLGGASDCSFRQAVIKANSASGSDTIMLPAGTISLSITGTKENLAVTGDVDVRDTLAITGSVDGSGNPTSIITGAGGWNDKFISTNKDGTSNGSLSISNVIFQNGNNTNPTTPSDPAFNYLGGALDFYGCAAEAGGCSMAGVSSLTLTNVRFVNNHDTGCTAQVCGGGADASFGPVAISGSSFSGNVAAGQGGALSLVGAKETMTVTNSSFTGNQSTIEGGAILVNFENNAATGTIAIHNSTISNNTSTTSDGGGIYYGLGPGGGAGTGTTASATIDQKTVISGNSAQRGGGLVFKGVSNTGGPGNNTSLTISKTTITGNTSTAGDGGGGIFVLSSGHLNVSFSRIVGNIAPAATPTGLSIQPAGATVTATDNWWGCDTGPAAAPCNTAAITGSAATLTVSPWLVLGLAAAPTSVEAIAPNNTSALTADFLHDSSNGAVAVANLDVLLGLPITFGANAGSISAAQTTIQSNGTATATFTHAASCAASSANATVDTNPPPTVSTNITILCPDLVTTKANSLGVSGVTTPLSSPSWTWFVNIANPTAANGAPATFTDGQTILTDSLPGSNISYGAVTIGGVAGTVTNIPDISCSIVGNVLTCSASGGSVTLGSGGGGGTFQASFTATATAAGSYVNPTGGSCGVDPNNNIIEFNEANNSCSNTVIVVAPPTIAKAFSPAAVPVSTSSTLTFTLTNPPANTVGLTGVGVTDILPAGLTVVSSSSSPCGGTLTTTSPSTIALSNASIAPGGQCQFSVNVGAPSTPGAENNTTGNVQSANGGQGLTASATLNVFAPPSISKQFGAASIPLGGSTSVSFQITNPSANPGTLSAIAFSDSLPAGLVVATPPGTTSTCNGTVTATAGTGSISMSGTSLAANSSCTVTANVTGNSAGVKNNSVSVSSGEGGPGNTASASLSVIAPPTLGKVFGAPTIVLGGSTSLSFTVGNPSGNLSSLTVSFTDSLPSGLVVASPSGLSTTCGGTASAAAGTVSLSAAPLTAGTSCTLSLNVTAVGLGAQNNSATPTSPEGGAGTAATASVTVNPPVAAPTSTALSSSLNPSFTTAPNNSVTFTATVTSGGPVTSGTVTFTDGATPIAGGTAVAVNGSGQAQVTTTFTTEGNHLITATYNGTLFFSGSSGNLTQEVDNHTAVSGNQYCNPGAITLASTALAATPYPSRIFVSGAGTSLTSLTMKLNGLTSNDVKTWNLLLVGPNGKKYVPFAQVSDGTPITSPIDVSLSDAAGSSLPAAGPLTGGTFKASSYAGASVVFFATAPAGPYDYAATDGTATFNSEFGLSDPNGTWQLYAETSDANGQGSLANGWCLNVVTTPPDLSVSKTHTPAQFVQGDTGDSYTITVKNNGPVSSGGTVTVTDTLPSGLTATAATGTNWSCTVGNPVTTCTSTDVVASGNDYPVITLTVDVASNAAASVSNSVTVSGSGDNTIGNDTFSDPTTVNPPAPDLTITKTHSGSFSQGDTGKQYTITVTNSGGSSTSGTVTVNDTLPAGLTATAISGGGWTCTVTPLSCHRSDALAGSNSYPAITLTVSVAANAASPLINSVTVSGGNEVNTANDTATDSTTIGTTPDLSIAKTHSGTFTQGGSGDYNIVVTNNGPGSTSGTVTVTDPLPSGLTIQSVTTGNDWTCTSSTSTQIICTSTSPLTASQSYSTITAHVNIAANAPASVTNIATVSGSGDNTPANDSASDPTPINPSPADLTITKTHSGTFSQGDIGKQYTITVTNSGHAATSGTVSVLDNVPVGLTATGISGIGWTCSEPAGPCTRSDSLSSTNSYSALTLVVNVSPTAGPSVTNSATVSGGGETNTSNDTATDLTTIGSGPDLTITKTHSGTFSQGDTGKQYSITVTNSGVASTSGAVTVTDTLPAGLTATAISGGGWTCTLTPLSCNRSDALAGSTSYPAITLTVSVASNATSPQINSATVSGGSEVNTGNDTATDSTTIGTGPDLTITKTHSGTFSQGDTGKQYSITVTNSGVASTSGAVTVTDTLPAGLTAAAISGGGWACTLTPLSCNRSDALAGSTSYPAITLTVSVASNATSPQINSATVSGGSEVNTGNDTATDSTTIGAGPDLTITKTHSGTFSQGDTGKQYSITVTNSGVASTSGAVTVTDTLPAGLTATAISGGGWTCTVTPLSCSRSDALAGSTSYPAITLTVSVASNATSPQINSVTVSGGNEVNTGNDTATDSTTIGARPDLTITKTHSGTFSQGDIGRQYTITVKNSGVGSTNGPVTVTDTLPSGLTATAFSGGGWTCTVTPLSCNRSDALAGGTSYPAITLTVSVASNATSPQINSATVSGGNEVNTANDTATDSTTIGNGRDLTITKTHSGNFTQGQTGATYSIVVKNIGGASSSGTVSVTDTLPSGMTATSISGSSWSCTLSTLTCTRNDALSAAHSYPTITLKVNVSSAASSPLTNTATVSGGGDSNPGNNSASDPTTINPGHADLTVTKTHSGNFTQGQTGAVYTITVSNSGGPTSGTVHVTDSLPSGLTATAISGSGWSCSLSSKSCSRSDVLPAASSYPSIQLTVNVASNAPASVVNSVTVSGGGESNTGNDTATDSTTITPVAGQVTVTPTTADFGNVNLGSSKDFVLTVKNGSGSTINITNITITPGSGPAKNDFGYDTKCGGSLSAGKTCTITAKLHAQDLGSGTATLNIFFNGAGSPLHVALSGVVINPKAKLNKSSIDFGSVKSGHSSTNTVTLTSVGDTPLLISSIVASGTGFTQTNNCPASLSPNHSCTVNVTFTASSKASCAGSLKINDNATGSPQTVALSAKGD